MARSLTVLAVVAFVGAGLLAFAAVRASDGDAAVLHADDLVAPVIAPTMPSAATEGSTTAGLGAPDATEPPLPSPTDRPNEPTPTVKESVEPRPQPAGLRINTIDVSGYPVRAVGIEDDGWLELPDETEIGWYKYGATAGQPGATVLAAHVNWQGSAGPFSQLGTVEPGDQVEVVLDDGSTLKYEVTERTTYAKLELPKNRIWRSTGDEELVLITCGGDFNPNIRSYESNIVIYAMPIA